MADKLKKINWIKAILIAVVAVLCIIMGVMGFFAIRKAYIRFMVRSSAYGEIYDTLTDAVENGLPDSEDSESRSKFGNMYHYNPMETEAAVQEETEAGEEEETDFVVGSYTTTILPEIGYVYKDVNKDGVKDFLVCVDDEEYNATRIYELFTLDDNGNPIHVFSGNENSYLTLTTDGYFIGDAGGDFVVQDTNAADSTEAESITADDAGEDAGTVDDSEAVDDEDADDDAVTEDTDSEDENSEDVSDGTETVDTGESNVSADAENDNRAAEIKKYRKKIQRIIKKAQKNAATDETEAEVTDETEEVTGTEEETAVMTGTEEESAGSESVEITQIYALNLTSKGLVILEHSSDYTAKELHLYAFE